MTDDERFLVSSSMATIGKFNAQDAEREKLRVFSMYSWALAEYEEACADASFYDHVVATLDATTVCDVNDEDDGDGDGDSLSEAATKKHALDRKLYYAGGSCRLMFQRTTEQIKQRLQMAMANVPHNTDLIEYCCGAYHHDTMHLLYGMASDEGGLLPVSSYAVSLFAKESQTQTIEQLAGRVCRLKNPVVNGYLLEWLLLALVPKRRVKLVGVDDAVDELPRAFVFQFDPKKRFKASWQLFMRDQRWLQPVVRNHGGYDAVYYGPDQGNVIFIQVARSQTHHFKMRFFIDVLRKLQAANMQIASVEIFFVVKSAQDLQFPIGEIDGRDELGKFDARWKRADETHVKVRAFEMVARF